MVFDRDTYQLVEDPHIKVLYNRRGVSDYALYDEAGILERTGVTPAMYQPVGEALLGRVVNALGQPIDGKGPINAQASSPIEKVAPGVITRQSTIESRNPGSHNSANRPSSLR